MDDKEFKERFERDHTTLNKLCITIAEIETWKDIFEKYIDALTLEIKDMSKTFYKATGALILAQIIILPIVFFFLFKYFSK